MNNSENISFINFKYVFSFAIRFCGIILCGFILLGTSLFVLLDKPLGASYLNDIVALSDLQRNFFFILLLTGVIQGIIISFILFVISLFWAHAISGPLARFRKVMSMVSEGISVEGIYFRQNDQLHSLARIFTHMQAFEKKRYHDLTLDLEQARKILEECKRLEQLRDSFGLEGERKKLAAVYNKMEQLLNLGHKK